MAKSLSGLVLKLSTKTVTIFVISSFCYGVSSADASGTSSFTSSAFVGYAATVEAL